MRRLDHRIQALERIAPEAFPPPPPEPIPALVAECAMAAWPVPSTPGWAPTDFGQVDPAVEAFTLGVAAEALEMFHRGDEAGIRAMIEAFRRAERQADAQEHLRLCGGHAPGCDCDWCLAARGDSPFHMKD